MKFLLLFILNTFVIGLFLYSKLLPHRSNLDKKYNSIFVFFDNIFAPVLNFFKRYFNPFQIGNGLKIDLSQIVLVVLLLLLINAIS